MDPSNASKETPRIEGGADETGEGVTAGPLVIISLRPKNLFHKVCAPWAKRMPSLSKRITDTNMKDDIKAIEMEPKGKYRSIRIAETPSKAAAALKMKVAPIR
jgi:hypothetical protein